MGEVGLAQLREQCGIPRFADIVLARSDDRVHLSRRGYCVFYAYHFRHGFRIPLPLLVVDFLPLLQGVPWSGHPLLLAMLIKYAELARREITLGHVLTLYTPQWCMVP